MAGRNRIAVQERRISKSGVCDSDAVHPSATPEIRIVRQCFVPETIRPRSEAGQLSVFLNEQGRNGYGDGITYAMGSMAVSYVTAQEFGKMLSEKYPDDYGRGNTAKTRRLVNSVGKELTAFIRHEDTMVTKLLGDLDDQDLCHQGAEDQYGFGGLDLDCQFDLDTTRLARNKLWQTAQFAIRSIEPYNGEYLGFDLVDPENEALRSERAYIIEQFLRKDQKLDTRHIKPDFDPHAVFFRGFRPIGQLALRHVDPPGVIELSKPAAVVNFKK